MEVISESHLWENRGKEYRRSAFLPIGWSWEITYQISGHAWLITLHRDLPQPVDPDPKPLIRKVCGCTQGRRRAVKLTYRLDSLERFSQNLERMGACLSRHLEPSWTKFSVSLFLLNFETSYQNGNKISPCRYDLIWTYCIFSKMHQ